MMGALSILFVLAVLSCFTDAFVVKAPLPSRLIPSTSSSQRKTIVCQSATSSDASSSKKVVDWAKKESLESLVPKTEAFAIVEEILSSDELIDDTEAIVSKNWDKLEKRLRDEDRPPSAIIGRDSTEAILRAVKSLDGYDPESVRAFLSSDAINSLFGKILYDGIFEFFQRIDVFGNIINGLPIIGPIRQQIVSETKKALDRSLGPSVQSFLGTYTRVAVAQASDFILSSENRQAFSGANVRLVASLLGRPVNSLLPPPEMSQKLKDTTFEYLRKVDAKDVEKGIDIVYDYVGDKCADDLVDVDKVLAASPTLQSTVDRLWARAITASENKES